VCHLQVAHRNLLVYVRIAAAVLHRAALASLACCYNLWCTEGSQRHSVSTDHAHTTCIASAGVSIVTGFLRVVVVVVLVDACDDDGVGALARVAPLADVVAALICVYVFTGVVGGVVVFADVVGVADDGVPLLARNAVVLDGDIGGAVDRDDAVVPLHSIAFSAYSRKSGMSFF
jgi:hypothetical protein